MFCVLQGSYGVVKLAYDEGSEQYYVSQSCNDHMTSPFLFLFWLNFCFLGNESGVKKEADEAVWISAWVLDV